MINFDVVFYRIGILGLVAITLSGCGDTIMPRDPELATTSASVLETSTQLIGSQANAVENSYGQITSSNVKNQVSSTSCQAGSRSACTVPGNSDSIFWNQCRFTSGFIISGGWSEVFSSPAACASASTPLSGGNTVRRKVLNQGFRSTIGSGVLKGARYVVSTAASKTFDGVLQSDAGVYISQSAGVRTLQISALRDQLIGLYGFHYSDVTVTGSVRLSGSLATGTRAIESGDSLISYDNLKKEKRTVIFDGVMWINPNCCYPTQGMVFSSLTRSDGSTASAELDFLNTCGQSTFIDENGVSSTVTLQQCL